MKILAVFLLAVLGCNWAAGRIVSKCELRDQLVKALGNPTAQPNGLRDDNLVATFVCHAGLVSGFNTSAVKEVINREQGGHPRGRRNAHESPSPTKPLPSSRPWPTQQTLPSEPKPSIHPSSDSKPKPFIHPSSDSKPKPFIHPTSDSKPKPSIHPTSDSKPKPSIHPTSDSKPKPSIHPSLHPEPKPSGQPPATHRIRAQRSPQDGNDNSIRMLYGIFQLSNHLACSDGTNPSPNICGLDCSKLVDHDISDDVSCMLKVTGVGKTPIPEEGCRNVQASDYFAACPLS